MNKTVSKALQIALPLILGIFLIWYIYQSFSPQQLAETKQYFSEANYSFVLLSVLLSALSHLVRAYRWGFMLEPMGYKPKITNSFLAISAGYLFNILIPRSGEVSRAVILDKYEKVPFQKGFGTVITERVIDLFFLLLFTTLAVLLEYDIVFDYLQTQISSDFFVKILIGLAIVALAIPAYIVFSKSKINQKIKSFIFGLKEGVLSILKMNRKMGFVVLSFLIWVLYVLSFYAAFQALSSTASAAFGVVIIAFVVGSFTLTFTHNGFGAYPVTMAAILLVFGIPKTAGVAIGWIIWTSNILYLAFFGIISLLLLPILNKKTDLSV